MRLVASSVITVASFQAGDFRVIGKLVATSIIQGGPGFPVMLPAAYRYMQCGDYQCPEVIVDVPDPMMQSLLCQVQQQQCTLVQNVFNAECCQYCTGESCRF